MTTHQKITDRILDDLRAGTAPWVKPWTTKGPQATDRPRNAVSGRKYSGTNVLVLWCSAADNGFASNAWVTFKQAKKLGGTVRKGERGTFIVYAKMITKTELDDDGEEVERTFSVLKGYTVFNLDQCDDLAIETPKPAAPVSSPERIEAVEKFVAATGATVRHGGARAYFCPSDDHIQLPAMADFRDAADYYATSLHEHAHWSGVESRLDRTFGKRFGDAAYAAEELVAEMTAAFLCADLGIKGKLQHAEYIATWIKLLEGDAKAIFTASARATEAADFLSAFSAAEELDKAA